jgi:RNA polymerase sigma factor (sigma-70 family)
VSEEIVRELASQPKDPKLWLDFFEKLRPQVYYSVYRACRGERDLAADLTQEAFVRFYKYATLKRFESDAHALAYLRQTARHLFVSSIRKSRPEQLAGSAERDALNNAPDPAAADALELLEMQHDIGVLAQRLNPNDRALLTRLLAGESMETIAQGLNLTYGAAAVRVHRLTDKMRNTLNWLSAPR